MKRGPSPKLCSQLEHCPTGIVVSKHGGIDWKLCALIPWRLKSWHKWRSWCGGREKQPLDAYNLTPHLSGHRGKLCFLLTTGCWIDGDRGAWCTGIHKAMPASLSIAGLPAVRIFLELILGQRSKKYIAAMSWVVSEMSTDRPSGNKIDYFTMPWNGRRDYNSWGECYIYKIRRYCKGYDCYYGGNTTLWAHGTHQTGKDPQTNYRYFTENVSQLLYIQRLSQMGISLQLIRAVSEWFFAFLWAGDIGNSAINAGAAENSADENKQFDELSRISYRLQSNQRKDYIYECARYVFISTQHLHSVLLCTEERKGSQFSNHADLFPKQISLLWKRSGVWRSEKGFWNL